MRKLKKGFFWLSLASFLFVGGCSSTPALPETLLSPPVQGPEDPTELMNASIASVFSRDKGVVEAMGQSGNRSFVPVLNEFLRVPWFLDLETLEAIGTALERLTGESFGYDGWDQWADWTGRHPEVQPPEGFAGWKGRLFSSIDPEMGAFLYDGVQARIRLEEIVWGGVVKDGIPDLTNPPHIAGSQATYLNPSDRVFGVSVKGEHRAYPLRILNPHEMANDVVGGMPFSLAY